ncbi:MAG: 2'-5' RNA ligase [Clostridiales bacterium]|jgi:2'-5' RNA ligase|nr:2'-5' RNA ligase [Clostridiales bacterium]
MEEKSLFLIAVFDDETQKTLAGYYDVLRRNGFTGSQTKDIPYHITLGNRDTACEEQLINKMDNICAETNSIKIMMSHIGLFGLNVLFIAPNMNTELLTLQRLLFFPEYTSGCHHWAAHATLLIDEPDKILKALPDAAGCFKPFEARIVKVALYEFFPIRFIKEFILSASAPR